MSARLKFDASVAGSIDVAGTSQYFSFQAQKYGTYTFNRGDNDNIALGLIAADGKTLIDRNIRGSWTAHEAGTYYLWVRAADPLGTLSFSFSVGQELDDYGNSAAEAAPIEVGEEV